MARCKQEVNRNIKQEYKYNKIDLPLFFHTLVKYGIIRGCHPAHGGMRRATRREALNDEFP